MAGEDEKQGKDHGEFKRSLTFWKLCALTFASVAGGPYGFEEAVGAGGPYLTILGLLLIPFIWSVPNALMTAELACMMPENGGHILWVDRAFGSFWSFLNSYATLFSLIFEGGLYPVMFMDYMGELLGKEYSGGVRIMIGILVILLVTAINIMGTDLVGNFSIAFTLASLGPFILIILIGGSNIDLVDIVEVHVPPQTIEWGTFITILLWSTSGFDLVGACAGEVQNPGETFPAALSFAMGMTLAIDVLSMVTGMSVVTDYENWHDGTFMDVAEILGGKLMTTVFVFGAAVSVIGLLCTLLCSSSRIIYGMAMVGTLPKVFATTSVRYGTPHVAILANAVAMMCVLFLPFAALAEGEMWFYSVSTIMKFAALCQLRRMEPDRPRPYKIPMTDMAVNYYCIIPTGLCVVMLVVVKMDTLIIGAIGLTIATVAYWISLRVVGLSKGSLIAFDVLDT
mmetsp:Transcript_31421/g.68704  ORF Transcript_31421/g.68704 Transcript_31421/m.68704 type:complete len:454 (-) Transcript_31421:171-1532(-)|eukprot:CAMPEP_0118926718 /NCGR_PEP_ID=MMETSP1169-20130426/4351_1 /TAXON_ID=36882 /ORGANISM="Pyramimonas obovata, Strain CCMP722" /LENGTH=453 /DNA_ID=CAMNT_0006868329 /DNA_START=389 /DNA_END=1750 /DNA_ORIENTATION=-